MREIEKAAEIIRKAKYAVAFTGAGISRESGVPTFRGDQGVWNSHHPIYLEIDFFQRKPLQSWQKIKEIFYDPLQGTHPNLAHEVLAKMEGRSFIESVITQNIDGLHQQAGSKNVYELHGSLAQLICMDCGTEYDSSFANLNFLPPSCYICKGILKPDIVFFNEEISPSIQEQVMAEASKADVMLVIGTHAEVLPAADLPVISKKAGAAIVEINVAETHLSHELTDIFLQGTATEVLAKLGKQLYL